MSEPDEFTTDTPEESSQSPSALDRFSAVTKPAATMASSPLDQFSAVTKPFEGEPLYKEIPSQFAQGVNEYIDSVYNLPSNIVNLLHQRAQMQMNAIRREAGVPEQPITQAIEPARIASRFNEPDALSNLANDIAAGVGASKPFPEAAPKTGGFAPTRTAGRYARAIGEQIGAAALPTAGMVAGGLMPATGRALGQMGISATGAGVAGETAKEAGAGPIGQTVAQIAGGFAAPPLFNIGKKFTTDIPKAMVNYGRRVTEEARNPQLGADRDILDWSRRAGFDLEKARSELYPDFPHGSNLPARGFTRENLANIILRRLDGEDAADIARDYGHLRDANGNQLTAKTIDNYVRRYQERNLTPMNYMDLAQEQKGFGAVQPLLRGARQKMIIANPGEAPAALYNRQLSQPARMRTALDRALPQESTIVESDLASRIAQEEAINAIEAQYPGRRYQAIRPQLEKQAAQEFAERYPRLWAQENVPLDETLARILADPLGKNAYELAMRGAQRDGVPIPSHEELLKMYGLWRNPGLGLDAEGIPRAAPQYENVPPVSIPVRALDYFQRALRRSAKAGRVAGNPEAEDFNTLRQQLREHLDPENAAQPPLVPGFRQLLSDYRAGMADREAMDLAAGMSLSDSEKTINALQEFSAMPPSAQELFRLRFARQLQNIIGNRSYGSDPLAPFNSRSAELIMRHVFGDEGAARIMTGLEGARRTNFAMKWGENLAFNLGNANTRQVLNEFKSMTPTQQQLALSGLMTKMKAALGGKAPGAEVAAQFSSDNAQYILRALLPEKVAEDLIRTINREVITTGGKNFIFGNSNTAQTYNDIEQAKLAAKAAAHLGLGQVHSFFKSVGSMLAQQIGEQRATYIVRQLTETNPPEMLRTLDRLIAMAPTTQERDLLRVLRKWGPWGPARSWMAGEGAVAAQNMQTETPPAGYPQARKAADGQWYVPDPAKPGSYLRVQQRAQQGMQP